MRGGCCAGLGPKKGLHLNLEGLFCPNSVEDQKKSSSKIGTNYLLQIQLKTKLKKGSRPKFGNANGRGVIFDFSAEIGLKSAKSVVYSAWQCGGSVAPPCLRYCTEHDQQKIFPSDNYLIFKFYFNGSR